MPGTGSSRAAALPRATPTGWSVGVGGAVLTGLGIVLGYEAMTIIGVGGLAAVLVGFLASVGLPDLEVEREIEPTRVERGRPALGLVTVRNRARLRTRPATAVEHLPSGSLRMRIASLGSRQSTSLPYQLPTDRRGALAVGPLELTLGDPLGLWRAARTVGETRTLFVKPRIYSVNPRPAGRTQHLEGPTSDTAPRGTLTFHALREYVLGDDIRRVHWKTTARTGTLMVREHVDTSQPSTVVVLDTRLSSLSLERFEEAVDIAASVVVASEQRGFPIRFATTTGELLLVRAGHRGNDLDDFLSGVQASDSGSMANAAVAALGGSDRDVVVVVAGDLSVADFAAVTTMTRRFGHRALVTVRDSGGSRWAGGTHVDGTDAQQIVAAWGSVRRGRR